MRPHAIARTNRINSRPLRVRSPRAARGPEAAGESYGQKLRAWRVVLTLLFGSLLVAVGSAGVLAGVADAASGAQVAMTADSPPPQPTLPTE